MALAISDVVALWTFSTKVNNLQEQDAVNWKAASSALRAMIDDQAQLKAAMDAISATGAEPNSKALADASIAVSEGLIA